MNDEEFIQQRIKDLEESVRSFSSDRKQEGERWVANAFIENLRIYFKPEEVLSPENDPPDVVFRDACFEVKEIMDEGRERHKEYKEELKRVKTITDSKDLLKLFRPKTITIQEVYERCLGRVQLLERKYDPKTKANLDLLLYVNLVGVTGLTENPFPDVEELSTSGWRSISFVKGQRSCCFYANTSAPQFIKDAVGHISHLHPR
jgi:hypothetical protein